MSSAKVITGKFEIPLRTSRLIPEILSTDTEVIDP